MGYAAQPGIVRMHVGWKSIVETNYAAACDIDADDLVARTVAAPGQQADGDAALDTAIRQFLEVQRGDRLVRSESTGVELLGQSDIAVQKLHGGGELAIRRRWRQRGLHNRYTTGIVQPSFDEQGSVRRVVPNRCTKTRRRPWLGALLTGFVVVERFDVQQPTFCASQKLAHAGKVHDLRANGSQRFGARAEWLHAHLNG